MRIKKNNRRKRSERESMFVKKEMRKEAAKQKTTKEKLNFKLQR